MKKLKIMNRKNGILIKAFICLLSLILMFICFYIFQFNTYHKLNLELICTKDIDADFYKDNNPTIWYSLRDADYNGLGLKSHHNTLMILSLIMISIHT